MSHPASRDEGEARSPAPAAIVALLLGMVACYTPAILDVPFFTKGEPREAVVVQRMLAERDFVLPRRTVDEIPAKPPLFHWLGAIVSMLAGGTATEATTRLPSLGASLVAVVLTLYAGCRAFGRNAGYAAAVLLATSQQWIASSVTARVDMLLAASTAGAMFAFQHAHRRSQPWPDVFWLACALGVLAKGPIGLLLPVASTAAFLLIRSQLRYAHTIRWSRAIPLLVIPLVWYVLAYARAGDAFVDNVLSENLYRMVDADAGENLGHRHSPLFYAPTLLLGLAPWGLLLPVVIVDFARNKRWRDDARCYFGVWTVVTVVLFSLAESKRPVYLLSCYPAAGLLLADWIARTASQTTKKAPQRRAARLFVRALLAVGLFACVVALLEATGASVLRYLEPLLSKGDRANLFTAVQAIDQRRGLVAVWAVATGALLVTCARAAGRGHRWTSFAALAFVVAESTAVLASTVVRDIADRQSVKRFIADVTSQLPDGHPLYFYAQGRSADAISLFKTFEYAAGFYAGRPLHVLHELDSGSEPPLWFIAGEPTYLELVERAAARSTPSVKEHARYTYAGNPHRTPVVFVELVDRRTGARE